MKFELPVIPPRACRQEIYAIITGMRRGFVAVLVTLLLLPGSVFALSFSAPPAFSNIVAEIESFIEYLLAPFTTAHQSASTASAAPAASAIDPQTPETSADAQETASSVNQFNATSTNGAPLTVETAPPPERTVYLQPQTIERTVVQIRAASRRPGAHVAAYCSCWRRSNRRSTRRSPRSSRRRHSPNKSPPTATASLPTARPPLSEGAAGAPQAASR